ncbi:hypothetical protein PENANT_c029G08487 [Penicillium antarcticum]|uniref:Uncharacterized protein n=1 Tax=Penicillium antarcticum TaxID=416450 RepID=A0A1V6PW62_9EURO|nr:hypothetical protein PENANT_c029G08487 [Penicillium antarcticum]
MELYTVLGNAPRLSRSPYPYYCHTHRAYLYRFIGAQCRVACRVKLNNVGTNSYRTEIRSFEQGLQTIIQATSEIG